MKIARPLYVKLNQQGPPRSSRSKTITFPTKDNISQKNILASFVQDFFIHFLTNNGTESLSLIVLIEVKNIKIT